MYCPQCAIVNADTSKFCRSCGMELEAVTRALSGKTSSSGEGGRKTEIAQDLVERQVEGVRNIVGGVTWLALSVMMAVALAVFLPKNFDAPWILVWAAMFGWMVCVGGVKLGNGISRKLETKTRLRLAGLAVQEPTANSTPRQLSSMGEPVGINNPIAFKSAQPLSVTEETTRKLDD